MTELPTTPGWPIEAVTHLLQPVIDRAEREPGRPVAAFRAGDEFVDVTAGEFHDRVRQLAKGLLASGVQAGDRVALMAHTRYEWLLADYAILCAGGTTVPVYETSSAEQLQWIISDSGAVLLVAETPAMHSLATGVAAETPTCRETLVIDEGALTELERRGAGVDDAQLDSRIAAIGSDAVATIVYTSGTTGRPKGCALTHGNLQTNVLQNIDALRGVLEPEEVTLLFLPLAHVLTKIIALVGTEWGIKLAFASDVPHLQEELAMVRPTMLVAVPRIFEKVFNAAQSKARAEGHGSIFDRAVDVAIRWSRDHVAGRRRPLTAVEHAAFDRLVYRKLQAVFGGRLRFAFSGGGPLGERLTHVFNGVGVKVFEGYGLTETSPTLTLNRTGVWKPGTVGRPLAATAIRTAGDGEILAKGPQVFGGYWRNEIATSETFADDGWFRTGDLGELDDEGFLRITGRKKELIVTAAGKNVAPELLEDRIRAHPLVSQAVVVGDTRPFIAALVTLDEDAVRDWAAEHGRGNVTTADLVDDEALIAEVEVAIDDANRSVSRAESIRKFAVLPRDLTIESGELTPTLKVRRSIVAKSYQHVIDTLYS